MYFIIVLLPSLSLLISRRKMHQPFGPVSLHREHECAQYKNTEKHREIQDTENHLHKPSETERDGPPILSLNVCYQKHGDTSLILILLFSSLQFV